ncbi:hypothetical protein GUA87_17665 [Sneathiella sp. P13V-1]|uniref:hypothetical protein n=1 Tax=Sneathiella sp. P13V-1 TaxID=2697366 RepID=UPI00187BA0A2|nr:hypothetical protein [Sneathiella sp. P13V-1]MBE7638688.1 hypothetical protein [Sneathiella sp. P13V-1]
MITNFPAVSRDEDLACFAIWEHGRSKEAEILSDLEKHFEILGVFRVYWSKEHYNSNIARLYENPETNNPFYKYNRKIGRPPFSFIIVRDKSPVFTYMKTVSGAIEAVNKNIIDRKNEYRKWFDKPYQIHSSCNFSEFSSQSALILGMEVLEETLNGGNKGRTIELEKDLEGAGGWQNWQELFDILNYSSHYLLLQGASLLSDRERIKRLDILCNSFQTFASIANVQQDLARPFSGTVNVSDQAYPINIRFTGDGYYPAPWEMDMLNRRVLEHGAYVPCAEDLFFSLLYHFTIHEKNISEHNFKTLSDLSNALSFDWFPSRRNWDYKGIGGVLSGYMQAKKYYYEKPMDREVSINTEVVKHLPKLVDIGLSATAQRKKKWKSAMKKMKHQLRSQFRKSK